MNICLYGASSPEIDPVYLDAACSRSMGTRSSTAAGRRA